MSEAKTLGGSWRIREREREHVLCCRARSRGFETRSLLLWLPFSGATEEEEEEAERGRHCNIHTNGR